MMKQVCTQTIWNNTIRPRAMLLAVMSVVVLQARANDASWIAGVWKTEDGAMAIKIDKIGNSYQGRIAWLQPSAPDDNPLLDKNNPEPHLRTMPLKGNKILRELEYNEANDRWEGGIFYDFKSGTLFNCIVEKQGPGHLKIIKFLRNPNNTTIETWHREQ